MLKTFTWEGFEIHGETRSWLRISGSQHAFIDDPKPGDVPIRI